MDELRKLTARELARYIDHTALKPETVPGDISQLCSEAREYGFASVCINPAYVPQAVGELRGSGVDVCTVVGFPLGADNTSTKVETARWAVQQGARELDMVINIGWLRAGMDDAVSADISAVVEAAGDAIVKVIIETCLLTDDQKRLAARLTVAAGADFVKTSTGFSTGGATLEDVRLLREAVGPDFGVKAAGGIRDYETALAMIAAGATRIGASSGAQIVSGAE